MSHSRMSARVCKRVILIALVAQFAACNKYVSPKSVAERMVCSIKPLEDVTPERAYSGVKHFQLSGNNYTEYNDGRNFRQDSDKFGVIRILNYDNKHEYFFNDIMHRDGTLSHYAIEWPLSGSPYKEYYYLGQKLACRLGPCKVNGIAGVEWSFPDHGDASACISPDGLVLRDWSGGRVRNELVQIERRSLPPSTFLPAANVQIVSAKRYDQLLDESR